MSTYDDAGKLVLRLSIGILMLFHGVFKLSNGISGVEGLLASAGLPAFIAYGVYVGEVIAPLLLIVGLYTRPAALLLAINMLVAVALAHMSQLGELTNNGGWRLELQGLFFFGAIAIALMGGGRYSLSRR